LIKEMMVRIKYSEPVAVAQPEVKVPANVTHANSRKQWRAWLHKHHFQNEGVWLMPWKKVSGRVELTHEEAIEEALCFGWIDSKPNKLDAQRSLMWAKTSATGLARLLTKR
jgi:uncharacterized protein YdeI (YjbR/CyaY-like superfamily)